MIFSITIFVLTIIVAIGILSFSYWEVTTGVRSSENYPVFKISLRRIEKVVLYYLKHFVQWLIVTLAKMWFTALAKGKKWLKEKWPQFVRKIKPAPLEPGERPSFIRRAVIESKIKIKRAKENIKEKHKTQPKIQEEVLEDSTPL